MQQAVSTHVLARYFEKIIIHNNLIINTTYCLQLDPVDQSCSLYLFKNHWLDEQFGRVNFLPGNDSLMKLKFLPLICDGRPTALVGVYVSLFNVVVTYFQRFLRACHMAVKTLLLFVYMNTHSGLCHPLCTLHVGYIWCRMTQPVNCMYTHVTSL